MEYVLSKDASILKMLRDRVLERTNVTLESTTELIKKRGITPSWSSYMEAILTLSSSPSICGICKAPMVRNANKQLVCSLYAVHTFIRTHTLGPKCKHEIYLAECSECIQALVVKTTEETCNQKASEILWSRLPEYEKIKWI